jgi:hypothetical protein
MACAGIGTLMCIEHEGHQNIKMWPKMCDVGKVFAIKRNELRITWVYCVLFPLPPPYKFVLIAIQKLREK